FVVEQGWLLTRDLYLPPGTIQLREEDWIKLRLSKEELKQDRWKTPPPEHLQGASPKAMEEESEAMASDSSEQGRMRHQPPEEVLPPAGEPVHLLSEEEPPPLVNR
ncbi:MAG TPA: hypothetical protein VKT82_14720, partial [Ktedonobacterales bacterium]|nr:hypothetical protein [Ktedonobacterales bacterium]